MATLTAHLTPTQRRRASSQAAPARQAAQPRLNLSYADTRLTLAYSHAGLYDVRTGGFCIARRRLLGPRPEQISHARMLCGGGQDVSTAEKDHFLCYWFRKPGEGSETIQGQRLADDRGHLVVRLDPAWNHHAGELVAREHQARYERNLAQQFRWGQTIHRAYSKLEPSFPLSMHMVCDDAAESMFFVEN